MATIDKDPLLQVRIIRDHHPGETMTMVPIMTMMMDMASIMIKAESLQPPTICKATTTMTMTIITTLIMAIIPDPTTMVI